MLVLFFITILIGCDSAIEIAALSPERGELRESFSEPGRTRLSGTYPITMPVAGRIGRIDLKPGDPVTLGQVLAEFDTLPLEQAVTEAQAAVAELEQQIVVNEFDEIEKRLTIELKATIDATEQTLKAADAQVEAEEARMRRASKELDRITRLAAERSVSQQQLDDAALQAETAIIDLRQQEFLRSALRIISTAIELGPEYVEQWLRRKRLQRQVIKEQLAQARARLARARHELALAEIRSPIAGIVLERYQQGADTLAAGEPLLLLGNLDELEVVVEVLTQDALRLLPGAAVRLEPAVQREAIAGSVERIEPAGFTKLSSLGVEQQRVNVIVALQARPANLGVGYRLQARFYTGTADNALIVPRFSVLQAPDQSYYVFKIEKGRLVKQAVELGLRNDLQLEIRSGLSEGDVIVATPDTTLSEGQSVSAQRKD